MDAKICHHLKICRFTVKVFLAVLSVTGQQDFDRLGERIDTLLSAGEREVDVCFAPGTYYFRDGHLRLSGIEAPETIVRLQGDGTILIGGEDGQGATFSCGFVNRERQEEGKNDGQASPSPSWENAPESGAAAAKGGVSGKTIALFAVLGLVAAVDRRFRHELQAMLGWVWRKLRRA